MSEFIGLADELDYYSFIQIERNKRDAKQNFLYLNVELEELLTELKTLENA